MNAPSDDKFIHASNSLDYKYAVCGAGPYPNATTFAANVTCEGCKARLRPPKKRSG